MGDEGRRDVTSRSRRGEGGRSGEVSGRGRGMMREFRGTGRRPSGSPESPAPFVASHQPSRQHWAIAVMIRLLPTPCFELNVEGRYLREAGGRGQSISK